MTRLLVLLLVYTPILSYSQTLNSSVIDKIRSNLADSAKQTWELGTRAEAILELDYPSLSVFSDTPIPFTSDSKLPNASTINPVIQIAQQVLSSKAAAPPPSSTTTLINPTISSRSETSTNSATSTTSSAPPVASTTLSLAIDGSSGDPASLGLPVLIAAYYNVSGGDYTQAAQDEYTYLTTVVPRAPNGAISHRANQVQLWSDFMYMGPPFLALWGAWTQNQTILQEAYTQCSLYRDMLKDNTNLWKHIQLGDAPTQDPGHWATGNAWAAAGMLRVLATIQRSSFASKMKSQQSDLTNWIGEIHDGSWSFLQPSGLLNNYIDQTPSFEDASSTALLTSTVYRLSLLSSVHTHIPSAEIARKAISATNGSHIGSDGWLTPVVNPLSWPDEGSDSPEGEAFVLIMQASYEDWVKDGSKGVSGALGSSSSFGPALMVGLVTVVLSALMI